MTTITASHLPVRYLTTLPVSREVLVRHLQPTYSYGNVESRFEFMGSLREMFELNMGGGIPYAIIVALTDELDTLDIAL